MYMTTTIANGRLCNQIFRNLAVHFIAKKNNLYVNYFNYEIIKTLGINLYVGNIIHNKTLELTDDNYFSIYNSQVLTCNLNANWNFFQSKNISNFIYNYLTSDPIKKTIIEVNPFNERYNNNNDVCIHIRLDDSEQYNPGLNYYLNAIQNIQFNNLYICSDDVQHNIIKEFVKIYPNTNIINYKEIQTIQFASTCKNIILSHGSFSAIIGYLSFFSTVIYPEYNPNKMWFGDMFSIEGWIKLV